MLKIVIFVTLVLFTSTRVEANRRLLIIGDSITSSKFSYAYLFKQKMQTTVIAKSGASVKWMYKKIEHLELHSYTHLLILGGVNDINNLRLRYAKKYLSKIYKKARLAGLTIIGITLSPWMGWSSWTPEKHKMTLNLNKWIKSQSIDYVADLYTLVKNPHDPRELAPKYNKWSDHLHINQLAHRTLLKYISQIF